MKNRKSDTLSYLTGSQNFESRSHQLMLTVSFGTRKSFCHSTDFTGSTGRPADLLRTPSNQQFSAEALASYKESCGVL